MSETDWTVHEGSLYDYTAGAYCGVLITESVMKRLAKMQASHLADVRRLLSDEAERGNVYPSGWTLHHPGGKQTEVRYIDTTASLSDRIRLGTTPGKPIHKPLVFVAASMDEARAMADAHFESVSPDPKDDR